MIDLYVELLIRPQHMVFLVSDDFKNKLILRITLSCWEGEGFEFNNEYFKT